MKTSHGAACGPDEDKTRNGEISRQVDPGVIKLGWRFFMHHSVILSPARGRKSHLYGGVQSLHQHIEICALLIDAVKVALKECPGEDEKYRRDLVAFGRVIAQFRYAMEDRINHIESMKPPAKVSEVLPDVTAEEVHALIRSEHRSLGLDEPQFYRDQQT